MNQADVFKLLFADNEFICYGDEFATKVHRVPRKSLQEPFYCVNPLDPLVDYVKTPDGAIKPFRNGGRRSDLNVTKLRNFLFEIDSVPLDEQRQMLTQLGTFFASIVYSGGKSYHAIVSLVEPLPNPHTVQGVQGYKDMWHQLAEAFEALLGKGELFDRSCQNPSRLSRTPNGLRADTVQTLIHMGTMMSPETLKGLVRERASVKRKEIQRTVYADAPIDEQDMISRMPPELFYQLKYPSYWASGSNHGNYPQIFRISLWLIDSTGADRQMVYQVFKKYTVDYLLKNGYPEERIFKAIDDACNMKER